MSQSQSSLNLGIMKKDPIEEARRYVRNAHDALADNTKVDPETETYEDAKYVRAAGNYLWLGVLIALEAVFHVEKKKKEKKGKGARVSVDDYTDALSQRDHKLLDWVNSAYMVMHLSMNYDGIRDKSICSRGFCLANQIIDRCAILLPKSA